MMWRAKSGSKRSPRPQSGTNLQLHKNRHHSKHVSQRAQAWGSAPQTMSPSEPQARQSGIHTNSVQRKPYHGDGKERDRPWPDVRLVQPWQQPAFEALDSTYTCINQITVPSRTDTDAHIPPFFVYPYGSVVSYVQLGWNLLDLGRMFRYRHVDGRSWGHLRGSYILHALAHNKGEDDVVSGGTNSMDTQERRSRGHRSRGRRQSPPPHNRRQQRRYRDRSRSRSRRHGSHGTTGGAGESAVGVRGESPIRGLSLRRPTTIHEVHALCGHVALVMQHSEGQVLVMLDSMPRSKMSAPFHKSQLLAALNLGPWPSAKELAAAQANSRLAKSQSQPLVLLTTVGGAPRRAVVPGKRNTSTDEFPPTHGRFIHVGVYSFKPPVSVETGFTATGSGPVLQRLCVVLDSGWVWWWEWHVSRHEWKLLGTVLLGHQGRVTAAAYSVMGSSMVFGDAGGTTVCDMMLEKDPVEGGRIVVRSVHARCRTLAHGACELTHG